MYNSGGLLNFAADRVVQRARAERPVSCCWLAAELWKLSATAAALQQCYRNKLAHASSQVAAGCVQHAYRSVIFAVLFFDSPSYYIRCIDVHG